MADIFLSYATEDRKTADQLVKTLEAEGWSVFWDRVTPVGKSWDLVLEEQLSVAAAVTPLWSPHSVKSRWVRYEAHEGMEKEKLFPALIAGSKDTSIPPYLKLTQYADLLGWDGTRSHEGCSRLIAALANQLKSGVSAASQIAVAEAEMKLRRRREHHDVFLGYAREDHHKAESLARALEEQGVAVWWDRAIAVGESFENTILSALEAARAVIILWTNAGVQSEWVKAEAQFAMNAHTLIGVLVESVRIPLEFKSAPTVDLATWAGDTHDSHFQRMLNSLATIGVQGRLGFPTANALPSVDTTFEPRRRFSWIQVIAAAFLAGVAGAVLTFFLMRVV